MSQGIYEGRLSCDGNGNLLADDITFVGQQTVPVFGPMGDPLLNPDGTQITMSVPITREGPNHGLPVAYHDGSYVVVAPGEKSHNERHEKNALVIDPTQDQEPDLPGFAGTPDKPVEGAEHHWGATKDDPHYFKGATDEKGVVTNTKPRLDPDTVAAKLTGHTAAYTEGGES